jgi:hypothetical protein
MINLGFLTEEKLAAILIIPSSWGSQRAGHSPRTRTVCYASTWHQQAATGRGPRRRALPPSALSRFYLNPASLHPIAILASLLSVRDRPIPLPAQASASHRIPLPAQALASHRGPHLALALKIQEAQGQTQTFKNRNKPRWERGARVATTGVWIRRLPARGG